MGDKPQAGRWLANLAVMAASTALMLGMAEIGLRFLPVTDGLRTQPVSEAAPVFHFQPNRDVVWSKDAGFALRNRLHINNAGFVNDQDYVTDDPRPLLAVVGDSYVEALMVRYPDTMQGLLARDCGEKGRVYSFAASGAPLSQYLIWSAHAARDYHAQGLVINVVGNDFDESLARYKQGPGFHHYIEDGDHLRLQRVDYAPSLAARLAVRSALLRYALFNLSVSNVWNQVVAKVKPAPVQAAGPDHAQGAKAGGETPPPMQPAFVGNTSASVEPERLALSEKAIQTFLDDLPRMTGLPPSRIGFVVDGLRPQLYDPVALAQVQGTFFPRMRELFIAQARRRGFAVADLQPTMVEGGKAGARYEFVEDGHWNPAGHALAAQAARGFPFVQAILSGRTPE